MFTVYQSVANSHYIPWKGEEESFEWCTDHWITWLKGMNAKFSQRSKSDTLEMTLLLMVYKHEDSNFYDLRSGWSVAATGCIERLGSFSISFPIMVLSLCQCSLFFAKGNSVWQPRRLVWNLRDSCHCSRCKRAKMTPQSAVGWREGHHYRYWRFCVQLYKQEGSFCVFLDCNNIPQHWGLKDCFWLLVPHLSRAMLNSSSWTHKPYLCVWNDTLLLTQLYSFLSDMSSPKCSPKFPFIFPYKYN